MLQRLRRPLPLHSHPLTRGALTVIALLVAACDPAPPEPLGQVTPRCLLPSCGEGTNGGQLGGAWFPAFDLTGAAFEYFSLTSITWNGLPVSAFSLSDGVPVAVVNGVAKAGAAAIGTRFDFDLEVDEVLRETAVVLDDFEIASTPYGDLARVLLRNVVTSDYVCPGGWAILVADAHWDHETTERVARANTVSIACWEAAIAKATWEFGYDVYDTSASAITLHNTAIKAIRADYCGDGTTFTVDGVLIEITDESGINPGPAEAIPEVVWGPDGALCLNAPRHTSRTQVETTCGHTLPYCDKFPVISEWAGGLLLTGVL